MKEKLFVLVLLVMLCFLPKPAISFCFEEAGDRYSVSPDILWSIAKNESNFNPSALHLNSNGSYDYGLMQINSFWYKTLGRESWLLLSDPCHNVMVGAWILSNCIQTHGYTWEAVGCYNAKSKNKRNKYALKIYTTLKKYNLLATN